MNYFQKYLNIRLLVALGLASWITIGVQHNMFFAHADGGFLLLALVCPGLLLAIILTMIFNGMSEWILIGISIIATTWYYLALIKFIIKIKRGKQQKTPKNGGTEQ